MTQSNELISYGRRLSMLAAEHPDRPAVIFAPREGPDSSLTWRQLDAWSNQVARWLARRGAGQGSLVAIGLPNSPEHYVATLAVWKLGACVLPVNPSMPAPERNALLELARAQVVIAEWNGRGEPAVQRADLARAKNLPDDPMPDRISNPGRAIATGGSTGQPKIILVPKPWTSSPGLFLSNSGPITGFGPGQVQLIPGPLYHNSPFGFSHDGLFEDNTLVVMEKLGAAQAVELIERYRVHWVCLVPTMMRRIIQLPNVAGHDFSSLRAVFHTAAPCPAWLKQAWIDLLGEDRIYEAFGSAEAVGLTAIRGDEWLAHPGSVGRPRNTDLRILDGAGVELPCGEVGEIFMRPQAAREPTYQYLGSPPANATADGFVSVGDLGWVDAEGYLYVADRRVDLIVSGGANIYPAEVEAALTEHPEVYDVAVIGLADPDWGRRVHAIIQPRVPSAPPSDTALDAHCRQRLASYKVPKSYEFIAELPRDPSGKIRRSALVAARSDAN